MIKNFNINKNSTQSGRSLLSKCAGYTQYFLSDVYTNSTRTKKAQVETVQSGRSMIEMLGVLAIVGVLSVGGIAGYSKAMMKFKINKTAEQVAHIATNMRTLFSQQEDYGDSISTEIYKIIMPTDLSIDEDAYYSEAVKNAFNGAVTVTTNWDVPSWGWGWDENYRTFIINYSGLPKEACVSLATMDWGSQSSSGFVSIAINTDSGSITGPLLARAGNCTNDGWDSKVVACSGDDVNPTPMNVAKAAQACDCDENGCVISWSFK